MNQELIRLCVIQQQTPQEPDISPYQARLQSNLTYLATMADISMVKPGEVWVYHYVVIVDVIYNIRLS